MSAFLCDDQTFATLGQFMRTVVRDNPYLGNLYVYDETNAEVRDHYLSAGQAMVILHAENVRSVNARYNETSVETIDPNTLVTTSFQTPKSEYLPIVAKAIKCLEYQSCEADDYYSTKAYKVLTAIKNAFITAVAEGL